MLKLTPTRAPVSHPSCLLSTPGFCAKLNQTLNQFSTAPYCSASCHLLSWKRGKKTKQTKRQKQKPSLLENGFSDVLSRTCSCLSHAGVPQMPQPPTLCPAISSTHRPSLQGKQGFLPRPHLRSVPSSSCLCC